MPCRSIELLREAAWPVNTVEPDVIVIAIKGKAAKGYSRKVFLPNQCIWPALGLMWGYSSDLHNPRSQEQAQTCYKQKYHPML
jgi:hypothetical protein